jgi:hypothetical protein
MIDRFASLSTALAAAALCSACVIAPPGSVQIGDSAEIAKMGEQATLTCGAGQVKEVSAKSFSCK